MGRHREWRKIAKRERRRRIRTQEAKERNFQIYDQTSSEYQDWLKEQEAVELFEIEQVEKANLEEHYKWLEAERIALNQWHKLQHLKEKMLQKRLEHEAKLKLEWELEKERKKKEEDRLREIEENNKRKQQIFMENLEQFLAGDFDEPPAELMVTHETRPSCEPCPFFSKTASCRFGDRCSRNHKFPGISKVLLATNFYTHFGLDNSSNTEYDTDVMLEYEESDTYKEFRDFFFDVFPEFEKFGRITQFKVCHNHEKHLRGNTYVEFSELRCAVAAYRTLHTRWYGGKQLTLQFCYIDSWKNAICGLQPRKRCPKGRACNYLHVFRNPNNLFRFFEGDYSRETDRSRKTPPRPWRWSESPEVEIPKRKGSRSKERNRRTKDRTERSSERRREERRRDDSYHRESRRRNRRRSSERKKDRDKK